MTNSGGLDVMPIALPPRRLRQTARLRLLQGAPAAGPGDTVIACSYDGICGTGLHLKYGHLDIPVPLVLGHEGLGVIHDLGDGADTEAGGGPLAVGDVVMWASSIACGRCVPCRQYREPTLCEHRRTCGVNRPATTAPSLFGSWADHIVLRPGSTIVRVPGGSIRVPRWHSRARCRGWSTHSVTAARPGSARLGGAGSGPVGLAAALAQLSGAARVILVGGPAGRLALAARTGIGDAHVDIVGPDDQETVLAKVLELTARFDLGALVTTYPLAGNTSALSAVAAGTVIKAVLTS